MIACFAGVVDLRRLLLEILTTAELCGGIFLWELLYATLEVEYLLFYLYPCWRDELQTASEMSHLGYLDNFRHLQW